MQNLPTKKMTTCDVCGSRVYFRFRSSVETDNARFRRVYLTCPVCGASASRIQETEVLPRKKRGAVKFVYRK